MPEKKTKVKLGLKNLAMLPSYFDYILVRLSQKARLRPEVFVNFEPEPDPKSPAQLTTLPLTYLSRYFLLPFVCVENAIRNLTSLCNFQG